MKEHTPGILLVYLCLHNTLVMGSTCMKRVENYVTLDVKVWTRSSYPTRVQCLGASFYDNRCKGFEYISEGSLCSCLGISDPAENADIPCPFSLVPCAPGETNIYSGDYSAYIGCFVDGDDRIVYDALHSSFTMTISVCLQQCFDDSYSFAGLEAGAFCFCGNELKPSQKRPDAECNWKCSGDTTLYCGGGWRLSVYYFPLR